MCDEKKVTDAELENEQAATEIVEAVEEMTVAAEAVEAVETEVAE